MTEYRKKPVVIEAFKVAQRALWPEWFHAAVSVNHVITHGMGKFGEGPVYCEINTLEGVMRADEGDWIIQGIKGELYPCKPDIFEMTYEQAARAPQSATGTAEPIYQVFVGNAWVDSNPAEYSVVTNVKRIVHLAPQPARQGMGDDASIAQSSLSSAGGVPEGWKLVPKEPTQEMIDNTAFFGGIENARVTFIAMLAAAPAASIAPLPVVTAGVDELVRELANRFLAWPLPKTVCADMCATNSAYQFPRSGTNLLNAEEAEAMVRYVFAARIGDEADAQRYRKLKRCGAIVDWTHTGPWKFDEDIDAAIDAAIRAQQPEQGEGE